MYERIVERWEEEAPQDSSVEAMEVRGVREIGG